MVDSELVERLRDALAVDVETFQSQAAEEATIIQEAIEDGVFDNPQGLVGLEYEFYAVANRAEAESWTSPEQAGETGSLERVPRRLLEYIGFEKELGLHNAELSTTPQPLNRNGLRAQEHEVAARARTAQEVVQAHDLRLISDGIWTIPPTGEAATEYLTDYVTVDDLQFATNMSASARYHAMANAALRPSMSFSVPHATIEAETVLPESLITSIQPHYQVPNARDLPTYFGYALRSAAPLVALGANTPFLPPDLYDADADPDAILEDGHDEHRIAIFEQVMNTDDAEKVRFPHDIQTIEEALDSIVSDPTLVPANLDPNGNRFDDKFAHIRHKHGTYWRWVRPVFDGAARSTANARLEFRPLPAQPTLRDSIAFLAVITGLMVGFRQDDHPVRELDWQQAQENFYAAAQDGLDADLYWLTTDGKSTRDITTLYNDLFTIAAQGLQAQGISSNEVSRYLAPLQERVAQRTTPAEWKRRQARNHLTDSETICEAIYSAQQRYFERQAETLFDGSFADWLS